jgi:hypothetical protein
MTYMTLRIISLDIFPTKDWPVAPRYPIGLVQWSRTFLGCLSRGVQNAEGPSYTFLRIL